MFENLQRYIYYDVTGIQEYHNYQIIGLQTDWDNSEIVLKPGGVV